MSNPFDVAEQKADFDRALNQLGEHWTGNYLSKFKSYRYYTEPQKVIIGDILNVGYHTKERNKVYKQMRDILNGKK